MKKLKSIPKFKSEKEEREFWQNVDSTEYVDYSDVEHWQFPNLQLSNKRVSLRLPESIIDAVKIKARQIDVPYQTLMKQFIYKGLSDFK